MSVNNNWVYYKTYLSSATKSCTHLREKIELIITNTQLLMDSVLPKQRAYILPTRLMAAAFHHLFKDHVRVAYQFNIKDMVFIAGLFWFHVSFAIDKQEKSLEKNYKGDTVISIEYVKSMVKDNNYKEINVFQEQVTALELQLVIWTTTAESTKEAASLASSKVAVAERLQLKFDRLAFKDVVTKLETEIKILEDKSWLLCGGKSFLQPLDLPPPLPPKLSLVTLDKTNTNLIQNQNNNNQQMTQTNDIILNNNNLLHIELRKGRRKANAFIFGYMAWLWLVALFPPKWTMVYMGYELNIPWVKHIRREWQNKLIFSWPPTTLSIDIAFAASNQSNLFTTSGQLDTYPMVLLYMTSPWVVCLNCSQQILSCTFTIQWLSMHHKSIRGVNTSKTWFVTKGCVPLQLWPVLEFSLTNIIKYSTYLPLVKYGLEMYHIHTSRLLITYPLMVIQIPYWNGELRYGS